MGNGEKVSWKKFPKKKYPEKKFMEKLHVREKKVHKSDKIYCATFDTHYLWLLLIFLDHE